MRSAYFRFALCALGLLASGQVPTAVAAEKIDVDVQRLQAQLDELDADSSLLGLAGLERLKARQALADLTIAKSRYRSHALYLTERRVETATLMAQVELLRRQSLELDREQDQLLIEASRRDAELARRETDRLRLQSLAREEAAERALDSERLAHEQSAAEAVAATAEAEQARKLAAARAHEADLARQEAELAAAVMAESSGDAPLPAKQVVDGHAVYTLAGNAFASGQATLTTSARASLRSLGALLAAGAAAISIDGHSDGQGDATINQALSQRRADAVLRALQEAGVADNRMRAVGRGQAQPIADNDSAEGRAQNRRVEIKVK